MIVETFDLTKIYNKKIVAVDHLNLRIEEGEIFGLLGPNGAGKTTTMCMLIGLVTPTSGRAQVAGFDVTREASEVRKCIGYSTQKVGVDIYEHITGREYLRLFGHYYHMERQYIEKKVEELLELIDLKDAGDRFVTTYSGGMRKRLEIASALLSKPKVLFLDEPTLGLDIQTRIHIWDYIKEINNEGTAILLTTHYLEEADRLSDRIGIIDHGNLVALGKPKDLRKEVYGESITIQLPAELSGDKELMEKAKQAIGGIGKFQEVDGGVILYVNDSASVTPKVLNVLRDNGIRVESVTLSQPSLDDVFIKYTGRSMREG